MANNNSKPVTNGTALRIAQALDGRKSGSRPVSKIPVFNRNEFREIISYANEHGMNAATEITKANAHVMLLNAMERICEKNESIGNCAAYCTYHYLNLLMQDTSFIRYGAVSQEMLKSGQIGAADGIDIMPVSGTLMPAGTAFLIVEETILTEMEKLKVSGDLDFYYNYNPTEYSAEELAKMEEIQKKIQDIFHENEYLYSYHGGQPVLRDLPLKTVATNIGKTTIVIDTEKEKSTNKWFYITAEDHASLPDVVYGTSIDVSTSSSGWYGAVELTEMETEITPPEGHTRIKVVEVLRTMKPVGVSERKLNIG